MCGVRVSYVFVCLSDCVCGVCELELLCARMSECVCATCVSSERVCVRVSEHLRACVSKHSRVSVSE